MSGTSTGTQQREVLFLLETKAGRTMEPGEAYDHLLTISEKNSRRTGFQQRGGPSEDGKIHRLLEGLDPVMSDAAHSQIDFSVY